MEVILVMIKVPISPKNKVWNLSLQLIKSKVCWMASIQRVQSLSLFK